MTQIKKKGNLDNKNSERGISHSFTVSHKYENKNYSFALKRDNVEINLSVLEDEKNVS